MSVRANDRQQTFSRRKLLQGAAALLGAPLVVPASVLGLGGAAPPSDRVAIGCIGTGRRGQHDIEGLMKHGARIVAICDVKPESRKEAMALSGVPAKDVTSDFRALLDRKGGLADTALTWRIEYRYENGVRMVFTDTSQNPEGVRLEGTSGWILKAYRKPAEASDPAILRSEIDAPRAEALLGPGGGEIPRRRRGEREALPGAARSLEAPLMAAARPGSGILTALAAFAAVLAVSVRFETPAAEPVEPLVVTRDTVLEKDAVLEQPIVIRASHVTIDGNGATIAGPGKAGDPKSFAGAGIAADGCSGVTLRNVKVRGFQRGLHAAGGEGWLIEGCDFSGNFHDPEHGWGEQGRFGGMVLTRISRSVIRGCTAHDVWNALDLSGCDDNLIERNDLSRASNVCLKLWTSSRNTVLENNLSWGLRIKPGEVHARDSTCVLIESGSNQNRFWRNDITHGGDGVFIRVLNGWVSTGNVFIENDCSYANNNCIESWSPGNTYIRNRANHGSYGFWLGGSDQTRLIGNEAAWNGLPSGFHNAPEPGFGHGGIVIVGGSSSHTVIQGNHLHHNAGAGIAFRGDAGTKGKAWRTHHWIVQESRIEENRFGIWGRWGDWVHLARNRFSGNAEGNFLEDVTNLVEAKDDPAVTLAPRAEVSAPARALVGVPVVFDASRSADPAGRPLSFRWDLGGAVATEAVARRTFDRPGFYRVGVTVSNGVLADLGFRDLVVAALVREELGTEGEAARWGFEMQGNADGTGRVLFDDDPDAVAGRSSLRFTPNPYKGMYATAVFPRERDAAWDLSRKTHVSFWLRAETPNIPGFQEPGPVVRLHSRDGAVRIQPSGGRNLLVGAPYSEARWTWMHVRAPLRGDAEWAVDATGGAGGAGLERVDAVSISLDSWGGDPFTVWIDGLTFEGP
ncbi:MAG: right-handed parallel beta-helix repeat-containing protein [Planctomycetes bacterium]|nr:right-handed parallel beta-helix repeat-containing protein [Planctomycetota bacterium]